MTMTMIPTEVDDLTATWFTEVLGTPIAGIEVLDAHSGTTGRVRIALSHNNPALPDSLFVKLAPFDTAQRAFVDHEGMGVAEARFYAEIGADVPVRIPRCWFAAHDDEGRYIMVLEDLVAAGASYPDRQDPDLSGFVSAVVESFADLHAAFWASSRFADGGDLRWVQQRSKSYGSAAGLVGYAVDQLGDQLPDASKALAAVYLPHAEQVPALLTRGPLTLVHGDAHLGNMFSDHGTPGILDWAVLGAGPGLRDIAYFLGGSVPTEMRRAQERELVQRYCDRLATHDIALGLDEAWEQYRIQLLTGWIAAVVTAGMGAKWQSLKVGATATRRADAAIADHDLTQLILDALA